MRVRSSCVSGPLLCRAPQYFRSSRDSPLTGLSLVGRCSPGTVLSEVPLHLDGLPHRPISDLLVCHRPLDEETQNVIFLVVVRFRTFPSQFLRKTNKQNKKKVTIFVEGGTTSFGRSDVVFDPPCPSTRVGGVSPGRLQIGPSSSSPNTRFSSKRNRGEGGVGPRVLSGLGPYRSSGFGLSKGFVTLSDPSLSDSSGSSSDRGCLLSGVLRLYRSSWMSLKTGRIGVLDSGVYQTHRVGV